MTGKQLSALEELYLRALCVLDWYRIQGLDEGLTVAQFAATQSLDWQEFEELLEHLRRKDIAA